jgi:hypothetical protein
LGGTDVARWKTARSGLYWNAKFTLSPFSGLRAIRRSAFGRIASGFRNCNRHKSLRELSYTLGNAQKIRYLSEDHP